MGRELRRVPAGWQHPKDASGNYIPLHDGLHKAQAEWDVEALVYNPADHNGCSLEDWQGPRPKAEDYMPEWPEHERLFVQMYETCSEGTPLSPVMDSIEALAHWLADNGASAFGNMTATYEQWLATCRAGFAVSAVINAAGMRSGVQANEDL